jgi:Holliday junction resolvase RusA-like endonuclease
VVQSPGKKPFVQFYPDRKSADYEEYAGQCALFQLRKVELEGTGDDYTLPVRDCRILAQFRFNIPRPKTVKRLHVTVKPDVDNLAKSILDALVQGGVIHDDNLVTDLVTLKRYADADHPEGVEVDLTCLPL